MNLLKTIGIFQFVVFILMSSNASAMSEFRPRSQLHSFTGINKKKYINVASWNIRQASKAKFDRSVVVNGQTQLISEFLGYWFQNREIDVLGIQEFQDKTNVKKKITESPLETLEQVLPSKIKVIKGDLIREPTLRGNSSLWEDYCPIFFNSERLTCVAPTDSRIQIGIDYALGPNSQLISTIQTPRYVNWAYCESNDHQFDFVVSCVHVNYKTAEDHIRGLPQVISKVLDQQIQVPHRLRSENRDFLFLGDFNLDRRSGQVYEDWGYKDLIIDPVLPVFPKGTRWKKQAFTKLKDIYTFTEARKRSADIYDDVVHTYQMSESLILKYVDPLIDDFFVNPNNNKVDMKSLLSVSDHLPVIATFELGKDSD